MGLLLLILGFGGALAAVIACRLPADRRSVLARRDHVNEKSGSQN
jgi:hypothetical protein